MALIRVGNDILDALDNKQSVTLVLLDMSTTFDATDHALLINMLHGRYIRGTALQWFRSYLSDRTQSVSISDATSHAPTATEPV